MSLRDKTNPQNRLPQLWASVEVIKKFKARTPSKAETRSIPKFWIFKRHVLHIPRSLLQLLFWFRQVLWAQLYVMTAKQHTHTLSTAEWIAAWPTLWQAETESLPSLSLIKLACFLDARLYFMVSSNSRVITEHEGQNAGHFCVNFICLFHFI